MQYIIDEKEKAAWDEAVKKAKQLPNTEALQEFCTMVANNLPVVGWWNEGKQPSPWGCVLTTERDWYCDDCPSKNICPNEWKEWSK